MRIIRKYISDLFISRNWFLLAGGCVVALVVSFFIPMLYNVVGALTLGFLLLTAIDYVLLFFVRGTVRGNRVMAQRFSIGDENKVQLELGNSYPFRIKATLIDELPVQFQERSFRLVQIIGYRTQDTAEYSLRPLSRGVYQFGRLLAYVASPLGLLQRRIVAAEAEEIKVYPSFQQLRRYQLLATSEQNLPGVKRIRRLGHSMEFEKIKDYVQGDDMRTINWKATARSGNLMVNTFTDSRQQQIYCLIDKGRNMKMPFDGLTLLDHSINACLSLLNIVLLKQDKAGLITFSNKVNDIVPADRRNSQMHLILETLYRQQTDFKESDYEAVWATVHNNISQRSLLLVFTNFETYSSMERQLPYLRKLAARHLVCAVFFQNTLLQHIEETHPDTIEGIYIKTIADQFVLEKKLIVKELRRHGIISVLTTPQALSADVINKYLELKARQMV